MDGASTPEELEVLLEDSLLMGDRSSVVRLFTEEALLDEGTGSSPRRGGEAIAEHAITNWTGAATFLAGPCRVLQAGDIALMVTLTGINVVHRETAGKWKFVILHNAGRQKGRTDGDTVEADFRGSRRG